MRKSRVLVVDDDASIRSILSALLTRHGYEVQVCPSGESCLAIYPKFMPEVVLLDLRMPGMDGLAVMEELARHGYRISAGTLYPLLHGMERRGYLGSRVETLGGRRRRVYRATALGKRTLAGARVKVRELFGELFEEEPTLIAKPKETRHGGKSR